MHLNINNTNIGSRRTAHSSSYLLHSQFLAILSLRAIEPRAPFLQDSQSPGTGHSWLTPPILLLRLRSQHYKTESKLSVLIPRQFG